MFPGRHCGGHPGRLIYVPAAHGGAGMKAVEAAGESHRRFVRAMVVLNLVALVAADLSGQWDAAMHARGAVDTFWYPPHYGIYFALLAAATLSGLGLLVLFRAPGTGVARVRGNAALVLMVVANTLGFTGAPFDAWWHQTYGIDLSVWSPPHFHLLLGMVLAALACSTFFLDDAPREAPLRPLGSLRPRPALAMAAQAVALLLASFLFFEYEAGLANVAVRERPPWTYPLLWTMFSSFAVALPVATLRVRGTATTAAGIYLLARLAILAFDRGVLGFAGAVPYPLPLPAVAFDLLLARSPRGTKGPWLRVALAGLGASAVVVSTAPYFWATLGILPELNAAPWATSWPLDLAAGIPSALAGWWAGTTLRRLRPGGRPLAEGGHALAAVQ